MNDASNKNVNDDDAPLPLSDLSEQLTAMTYLWLQEEFNKSRNDSDDEAAAANAVMMFGNANNGQEDEADDDNFLRVREWTSSLQLPDGLGGYSTDVEDEVGSDNQEEHPKPQSTNGALQKEESCVVSVKYILSSAGGGHGDDLWAASRHVANLLADAAKCRDLLSPLWKHTCPNTDSLADDDRSARAQSTPSGNQHPLFGLRFLELGAGGGVPSWTAMWRGAKVVCTDQAIPDRIRCMAESAERNRRAMEQHFVSRHDERDKELLLNANMARVCPYSWGRPVDEVIGALDQSDKARFDVIVAADCIYMPDFHLVLLESIALLLSSQGAALLPFALHGNTKDDNVWGIIELAKNKGFSVEVLKSQQLTPQSYGMDKKRGLVHMLRLTRNSA